MAKLAPISKPLVLIVAILHLAIPSPASAELQLWVYDCNVANGSYTKTSTYKHNLDTLLTNLTNTDSTFGFYNLSTGEAPDAVYLMSLCLGGVAVTQCQTCQNYIKDQISSKCPNHEKKAVFYSDDCMIRYSYESMYGVLDDSTNSNTPPNNYMQSNDEISDEKYNEVVNKLVESLPGKASAGNSSIKFATGQSRYNGSITIYSAAQCTPDLTQDACLSCLNQAVTDLENISNGRRGARYLYPSCNVRYEEHMFYKSSDVVSVSTPPSTTTNGTTNDGTPPSSTTKGKGMSKGTKKIIAAVVSGSLCLLLVVVASFIFIRKRKLHWNTNNLIDGDDISNIESLQFNFSTIRAATGNFSEANKLGQGGFGAVYKGILPDSGQEIAVKRLAGNSSQGEDEFKTEVTLLARLQHRNLVRLRGFCFHDKERLLIYEFVANASLDQFLFGATRRAQLDWETRYKIIRGIARGILYLHEDSRLRVIHRDLKASNVLLDAEMCPKIADFGTARLFEIDQTHSDTRRIVGTYGYMAPEYVLHGNFSTKSDVYSFGVVLLEILCGKRCNEVFTGEISGSLISVIWRKWSEGTPLEVVDSAISDGPESEILRCIHIGLLCVQDNMVERPTMSSVVLMMSSASLALPLPLHPAYITTSNMPLNSEDVNWSTDKSTGLESITELHVR